MAKLVLFLQLSHLRFSEGHHRVREVVYKWNQGVEVYLPKGKTYEQVIRLFLVWKFQIRSTNYLSDHSIWVVCQVLQEKVCSDVLKVMDPTIEDFDY